MLRSSRNISTAKPYKVWRHSLALWNLFPLCSPIPFTRSDSMPPSLPGLIELFFCFLFLGQSCFESRKNGRYSFRGLKVWLYLVLVKSRLSPLTSLFFGTSWLYFFNVQLCFLTSLKSDTFFLFTNLALLLPLVLLTWTCSNLTS